MIMKLFNRKKNSKELYICVRFDNLNDQQFKQAKQYFEKLFLPRFKKEVVEPMSFKSKVWIRTN